MTTTTLHYTIMRDTVHDMGYVRLTDEKVVRSEPALDESIILDLDGHGTIVGIEILSFERLTAALDARHRPKLRDDMLVPELLALCTRHDGANTSPRC